MDLQTWLNFKTEMLNRAEIESHLTMPWDRFEALLEAGRARKMADDEPRAATMVTLPDGSRYEINLEGDIPALFARRGVS